MDRQLKQRPDRSISSLHDIVTDYIHTQAYASTARILSKPRTWGKHRTNGDLTSTGTEGNGDIDMDVADESKIEEDVIGKEESGEGSGGILSEGSLVSMERRRAILNFILNGAIMRAVEALNTYFPTVLADPESPLSSSHPGSIPITNGRSNGHTLSPYNGLSISPSSSSLPSSYPRRSSSNGHTTTASSVPLDPPHSLPTLVLSPHPAHIRLNLQIQAFIESFRQLAPSSSAPTSPESSIGSLSSSMHLQLPSGSGVSLTNALTAAQGLHQEAKKLPPEDRAVYLQEIKDVGALFAYSDPETSILRGFLDQERRIALAEQVNRAILLSQNYPPKSQLEHCARRVTALWSIMSERHIDSTPPWSASDGPGKEDLALYIKSRPRGGFSLRDYASHSTT